MDKRNTIFEKETQGKALLARAKRGEWDVAMELSDKLGPDSWHRRGLMGASAEEEGFGACWKGMGMPDGEWLSLRAPRGDSTRFARLQSLAKASAESLAPTPDKARHALEWLAWCAPSLGAVEAFDFMAQPGGGSWGLDVGAWAEAMASRAKTGSLGVGWRGCRGMWAMAGSLEGREAQYFAEAFTEAGLMPILAAAREGALGVAQCAIGRLDTSQALALFVAALCEGSDWKDFEKALGAEPENDVAEHWRSLVAKAARGKDARFDSLGVGSSWTELTRGHHGEEPTRRWEKAMGALASQAAPALAEPGMEEARSWVVGKAPGWARGLLTPGSVEPWDPSDLSAEALLMDLSNLFDGKGGSEDNARAAARKLWELSNEARSLLPLAREGRRDGSIQSAAMALWRSSDPKAFLAFVQELSASAGGPGAAARLCGFPSPALHKEFESQPGSPGHAIALVLAFPPDCVDGQGKSVWRCSEGREHGIRWLWERFSMGARMGMLRAGAANAWSAPLPDALPPMEQWSRIDLGEAKWRGLAEGREATLGWEGAFEAIGALALEIGAAAREARPPQPPVKECPDDLPTRMAWSKWAAGAPRDAAAWVGDKIFEPGASRLLAERVLISLSVGAKRALAGYLPEAFETECSGGAHGRRLDDMAGACRMVGRAVAPSASGAFAPDEVLCAALMCASAYGISRLFQSRHADALDSRSLKVMAQDLASAMPQAATAMMTVGFESGGKVAGFSGPELAGKAVWGSLSLAMHWRAGPGGPMMGEAWSELWEGIELDPGDAWTDSCLSALFTPAALARGGGADIMSLLGEASSWLNGFGAKGLGRLPGERSAIERAVDSRVGAGKGKANSEDGCFGEEVATKLVQLGADPSDPGAPGGLDALALCAGLERRASPSSVMKALTKSAKACPGRGALLARLSTGSGLSEKMVDALSGAALGNPELGALALLGSKVDSSAQARSWISRSLESSTEAKAFAGDGLLGEMAFIKAGAVACLAVAGAMKAKGLEPSQADRRALLVHGMLGEMKRCDDELLAKWAKAGASKDPINRSVLDGEMSKACVDAGLGPTLCVADALMARALSTLVDGRSGSASGTWALAAQRLDQLGYGSEMVGVLAGKLLEKERSISETESVVARAIGAEGYAKIEVLALLGASRPAEKAAGPAKRL